MQPKTVDEDELGRTEALIRIVAGLLSDGGSDARAGASALLRQLEETAPGEILRAASRIQLARLGLSCDERTH